MAVRVNVELSVSAVEKHQREMCSAAVGLTNDRESVSVWVDDEDPRSMFAYFTMPKARQMDVVDKIMHRFSLFMDDYATQSIQFPKAGRS